MFNILLEYAKEYNMPVITRPIRFFCKICGKEIWQEMPYEHIEHDKFKPILEQCVCSDCILKETKDV